MARKGKFGRATAGTQNLSSLVYTLLRQERDTQERTMITAYGNNMRSGSGTSTFLSNGVSNSANAAQVVAWYKAQAATAREAGDTSGAASFDSQAEEFRLASLKDMEALLDNAYKNGNAIDLSLLGGSGTQKVDSSVYEQYMNILLKDPSTTTADRQRLANKLYTVNYNKSAEAMVNGFNEKKYTAENLISFYDKELIAAKSAGLTEESQTYRDIQSARASAVARAKSDNIAARQDMVNAQVGKSTDALASDLQSLLKDSLPGYISDKATLKLLQGSIGKDGGATWMSALTGYLQNNGIQMQDLMGDAAAKAGWSSETLNTAVDALNEAVGTISSLNARGYGKELGGSNGWMNYITDFSTKFNQGAYAASTRTAVLDFTKAYSGVGGSVSLPGSGEPASTSEALQALISAASGDTPGYTINEIGTSDIIKGIGIGDVKSIFGTPGIDTIDDLVNLLSKQTGQSPIDAAYSLTIYLSGLANHPNQRQVGEVADVMNNLGLNTGALLSSIGDRGTGVTVSDILRLKIESEVLPTMAQEDGTKSMAYSWTDYGNGSGAFTFRVQPDANLRQAGYTLGFSKDGKSYYAQVIKSNVGTGAAEFIAVPGGGGAEVGGGMMDQNDIMVLHLNGSTYKLTAKDLENFGSYASGYMGNGYVKSVTGDFGLPSVKNGANGLEFVIPSGLVNALTESSGGIYSAWFSKRSAEDPSFSTTRRQPDNGPVIVGEDYIRRYASSIKTTVTGATSVDDAIKKFFASSGIIDPKGSIARALFTVLQPDWDGTTWRAPVSQGGGATQYRDNNGNPTFYGVPLPNPAPGPQSTVPNGNEVASGDPSFGWDSLIKPTPGNPMAPVPGMRTAGNIPTSEYMQYTMRHLGPELSGEGDHPKPTMAPSSNPVVPNPAPSVFPSNPSVSPTNPTMRPTDLGVSRQAPGRFAVRSL